MRTRGDKSLEEKFQHAFTRVDGMHGSRLGVKAACGLITFRGNITSKEMRLKIVTSALKVMDEVLGEGHRRITGNPR